MAIIRPTSDLLVSGWTPSSGSDAYAVVDETTASDTDYISASTPGAVARIALGTTTDPGNNDNHKLTYRASSPEGDRGLIARVVEYGNIGIVTSKQPWRKQPQGAVEVDWGNPITRGLVSAINPSSGDFAKVGTCYIGARTTGKCFVSTSSGYLKKTTPLFGSAATILNYGPIGYSNQSQTLSFGIGTSGSGNQLFIIQSAAAGSSLRALIRTVNGGGISSAESTSVGGSDNLDIGDVWVAVYNGSASLGLYRNGKDDVSTRINQGASGAMSDMGVFSIGGIDRGTDGYAPTGYLSALGLAWNRALSPAEIKSISAAPWQIFKPQKRISYFDAPKLIATHTPTLTTTPADYTIDLSSGEAGLITDYSKLGVEFEAT